VNFTHIRRLNPIRVKRVDSTRHEKDEQGKATKHHWQASATSRLKCSPTVSQEIWPEGSPLKHSLGSDGISRIENQSRYTMDYEAAAIARALKVSVVGFLVSQINISISPGEIIEAKTRSRSAGAMWSADG